MTADHKRYSIQVGKINFNVNYPFMFRTELNRVIIHHLVSFLQTVLHFYPLRALPKKQIILKLIFRDRGVLLSSLLNIYIGVLFLTSARYRKK